MKRYIKDVKMNETEAFHQYQLGISVGIIRIFVGILGVFSLLLMIPDYINITDPSSRLLAIIIRGGFALAAAFLFVSIKRFKDFKKLALAVSLCEIAGVVVFIQIFYLYESPNFMIQLLGLFIMIITFFIIPNRWANMLVVSIAAAACFIFCAHVANVPMDPTQMLAGVVYLAIEIALCATFAWYFNRYKRCEYEAKTELQRIYSTDSLTQVGNRVRLDDEAEKWIEFCSRYDLDLSLVLIDVDNLKRINDRYGHLIGDVILYEAAQIMHTQLRKNDVCTRWGGDEFVLLLPSTDVDEAISIAERIRQSISEKDFNMEFPITCSFGIASMKKGDDLNMLINQADKAMYAAKKHGKNNIRDNIQTIQ